MRLDSAGHVGIGTASPIAKLQVRAQTDGNIAVQSSFFVAGGVRLNVFNDAGLVNTPLDISAQSIQLATAGTERMRIDSAGTVGIGVTPSAWQAFSNLQIQQLTVSGGTQQGQISTNAYFNSGSYKYIANGGSARIFLEGSGSDGLVRFDTVAQGVANANFTYVERARVNAFGIGLGTAVPSSGTGITFPATQSASSDANTLDDYEEGTWTPAANRLSVSPTGVTYSERTGTYTKIGNVVTAYFDFTISGVGTAGSGPNSISGLPFSSANDGIFPVPNYRACSAIPAGPTATTRLAGYVAGTLIYLEADNIGNAGFSTNGVINGNWISGGGRATGWVTYRV
jgi:hypothetical protein